MKKGFTLIELMIVVAIIAIIAAIAIPSLLSSKLSANENAAAVSLKSLSATEATWSTSDTDRNGTKDFWVIDVSGFYRVLNAAGNPVANIDINFAKSDYNPVAAGAGTPTVDVAVVTVANTPLPKSGYFYAAFVNDAAGNAIATDKDGAGQLYENTATYAFQAFPEKYNSTGRMAFILSESNTIYKLEGITAEGAAGRNAGKFFNLAATGAPFAAAPAVTMSDWPNANPNNAGYAAHE